MSKPTSSNDQTKPTERDINQMLASKTQLAARAVSRHFANHGATYVRCGATLATLCVLMFLTVKQYRVEIDNTCWSPGPYEYESPLCLSRQNPLSVDGFSTWSVALVAAFVQTGLFGLTATGVCFVALAKRYNLLNSASYNSTLESFKVYATVYAALTGLGIFVAGLGNTIAMVL